MAYSKALETAVENLLQTKMNLEKKKMFGGVCYLAGGNIAFGIWQDYLIVRCGAEVVAQKLGEEGIRPFDITGRVMSGWLMVAIERWQRPGELDLWLKEGYGYALSLPEKG
jgi:TfoX/Sxy family transcriptional regulator of competence genes